MLVGIDHYLDIDSILPLFITKKRKTVYKEKHSFINYVVTLKYS